MFEPSQIWEAIKKLRVRGAPAIGVTAAIGLAVLTKKIEASTYEEFYEEFKTIKNYLATSRPTAVNLFWALNRLNRVFIENKDKSIDEIKDIILDEAEHIREEDIQISRNIGEIGFRIIKELKEEGKEIGILTHCNAGALATAGIGTALGVIREVHAQGKLDRVYADETRPLLQGSRLTAFELHEDGIPVTLQTDNMAGYAMQQGLIDAVIVGADRITLEGDVANKIGTYSVAVLAKYHNIPFYVAAPYSTFDFSMTSGKDIPIEMRNPQEVLQFQGVPSAPQGIEVLNPAFDVTPHNLVTAIITEEGVLRPPFKDSIQSLQAKKMK